MKPTLGGDLQNLSAQLRLAHAWRKGGKPGLRAALSHAGRLPWATHFHPQGWPNGRKSAANSPLGLFIQLAPAIQIGFEAYRLMTKFPSKQPLRNL